MLRTTSVLALGLFLGIAPIGALAQTQTDDTTTQQQVTQPSDTQQSTGTETLKTDDQQSTETETLQTDDDQQSTETETLQTDDDQQSTETETLQSDDQQSTTETETLQTDDQQTTDTDMMDANEEPDVAATTGTEEVIPAQEETEMLASDLLGAEVNLADESIGKVSDLIIGDDHMIKGVVVGVGGFLGIGEKNVALPMEQITVQPTEEPGEFELSASTTREELEAFEEFKTAAEVQSEEEAVQTQQQMDAQQPPAVPTQPQPQQ